MVELESQETTTDFQAKPCHDTGLNSVGAAPASPAEPPSELDDDRPLRGISIIPIPRREIARLKGTIRLDELPRHKPTIVFDARQQFRDAVDE